MLDETKQAARSGVAVIIGAGPAGLTAALELLRQTGVKPIVIEAGEAMGGLSRTVRYKGNRLDIGGHRFFSKSDRVMDWWLEMLPLERGADSGAGEMRYQNRSRAMPVAVPREEEQKQIPFGNDNKKNQEQKQIPFGNDSQKVKSSDDESNGPGTDADRVMLVRERKSRIYFLRQLFAYPIRMSGDTMRKLGVGRVLRYGASYLRAAMFRRGEERTLEDFLIRRFGRALYAAFFQSYTEKVWGVPCSEISAEWGAQRIKGLSLRAVARDLLRRRFGRVRTGIAQKETETSLIERFLYPKFGPGQLWELVAERVCGMGGAIETGLTVDRVETRGGRVVAVEARNATGGRRRFEGEYFFSTMPVKELVRALEPTAPAAVREVSEGLVYRDFITVGLLVSRLKVKEADGSRLKDNWIYIQEPDVRVGRVQIFNNWSPWMVSDAEKVWMGLEYFCNETDEIWKLSDEAMARLAVDEMARIGMLETADAEDWHVVRVPKTYPAYFGTYERFGVVREFLDGMENLFLIGRNGMHKYNNQDHSMLTAMAAVENIVRGVTTKENLWAINTEMEYHEEKA